MALHLIELSLIMTLLLMRKSWPYERRAKPLHLIGSMERQFTLRASRVRCVLVQFIGLVSRHCILGVRLKKLNNSDLVIICCERNCAWKKLDANFVRLNYLTMRHSLALRFGRLTAVS